MRKLLIGCLALCCTLAHAQIYRWTDAAGRTIVSDTPPPGKSQPAVIASPPATQEAAQPYAVRKAAAAFPVTLYTAPGCSTECAQARELLNGRSVPFSEKSVVSEEEVEELRKLVGTAAVPTLKVGRQTSRGFESGAWHKELDLAGYPRSSLGRPAGAAQ